MSLLTADRVSLTNALIMLLIAWSITTISLNRGLFQMSPVTIAAISFHPWSYKSNPQNYYPTEGVVTNRRPVR